MRCTFSGSRPILTWSIFFEAVAPYLRRALWVRAVIIAVSLLATREVLWMLALRFEQIELSPSIDFAIRTVIGMTVALYLFEARIRQALANRAYQQWEKRVRPKAAIIPTIHAE